MPLRETASMANQLYTMSASTQKSRQKTVSAHRGLPLRSMTRSAIAIPKDTEIQRIQRQAMIVSGPPRRMRYADRAAAANRDKKTGMFGSVSGFMAFQAAARKGAAA